MKRWRVVGGVVFAVGLVFGLWGGEYSSLDWWKLKRQAERERIAIQELEREIDSLGPAARALERDSATQERVAREKFGMIRPGEILFRLEPAER